MTDRERLAARRALNGAIEAIRHGLGLVDREPTDERLAEIESAAGRARDALRRLSVPATFRQRAYLRRLTAGRKVPRTKCDPDDPNLTKAAATEAIDRYRPGARPDPRL